VSQSYQNPDALKSWLKLVHAPGIGPATAHKLLEHFGDIASIAAANGSQLRQAGLREDAIDNLLTPQQTAIDTDLTWLEQAENRHIVSLDSRHYPALLKQIARPPLVLYVLGDVEVLHTPQLAMVGSRPLLPPATV